MAAVIRIIGMFRHNSCNSHRIWPYRIGARHMEDHSIAVQRLRAFKHCKIIDRAGLPQRIICKCDILRCQRFPVRKFDIIADCHRPCQSILRGFHIGSQIITNPQIRRCHRKSTLNQRLMDMFAGPPAIGGVKSRFRFGICCHNNHHRIFLLLCVLCLLLHCRPIGLCRTVLTAAGTGTARQGQGRRCRHGK